MPLDTTDYREIDRVSPNQLVLSPKGLEHIKLYEAFRAEAYDDLRPSVRMQNGGRIVGTLTIGYGHTGAEAWIGNKISEDDATRILLDDLRDFENDLQGLVKVPLTQSEYDALVGFVYNVGAANLRRSTLLRKLNAGDYDGSAAEFGRWVHSKGRRLKGLERRREAERALFLGIVRHAAMSITDMAAEGEALLMVGSRDVPDAVAERGVMKSLSRSKTIMANGAAMVSGVFGYMVDLDPRVQLVIVLLVGGYLIFNRWLEHRAGEH